MSGMAIVEPSSSPGCWHATVLNKNCDCDAPPTPWRFDVPEVPARVTAFRDAHGSIWVRTAAGWWRLLDDPLDVIGKPLAWVLQYAPLMECEDPRAASTKGD